MGASGRHTCAEKLQALLAPIPTFPQRGKEEEPFTPPQRIALYSVSRFSSLPQRGREQSSQTQLIGLFTNAITSPLAVTVIVLGCTPMLSGSARSCGFRVCNTAPCSACSASCGP